MEPIDLWVSYLHRFYTSPSRESALSFQRCILHSLWIPLPSFLITGPQEGFRMVITERSPEDMNLFITALDKNNLWSTDNSVSINKTINGIKFPYYTATIYIHTSPEEAFKRCKSRNRDGESSISFEYLSQLHNIYESWFSSSQFPNKVFVINGNRSEIEVFSEVNQVLSAIVKDCALNAQPPPLSNKSYSFVV